MQMHQFQILYKIEKELHIILPSEGQLAKFQIGQIEW